MGKFEDSTKFEDFGKAGSLLIDFSTLVEVLNDWSLGLDGG